MNPDQTNVITAFQKARAHFSEQPKTEESERQANMSVSICEVMQAVSLVYEAHQIYPWGEQNIKPFGPCLCSLCKAYRKLLQACA